jgi:hypothetical protein
VTKPIEITTDGLATDGEAVTLDNGMLVVDLAGLPAGSVVTLTVRVGPEPAPQPDTPKGKAYAGMGRPINGGAP